MAVKHIELEGIGPVSLYKRKGAKSVRLSITHKGQIKVSLPSWAPYSSAVDFALARRDWIAEQMPKSSIITHGFRIGKAHHVQFIRGPGTTVTTRLVGNEVRVMLPAKILWTSAEAQKAAELGAIKALKKESKMLLPHRLKVLADKHGYEFRSVSVKQLSGRWGSCNEKKEITLNCFLVQLPWELIDYVLLHELAHTKVLAHGPRFWAEMERVLPEVKSLKKTIKTRKPVI